MEDTTPSSDDTEEIARRHADIPDVQDSFRNVISDLLSMRPPKPAPHPLIAIIKSLPQELQDEIYEYTLLNAHERLHRVSSSILEGAKKNTYGLTKVELLKFSTLVHLFNEMLLGNDSTSVRCHLVHIFAVYKGSSTYFLWRIAFATNECSLFEAVIIYKIHLLARECANLPAADLPARMLCDPRFQSIEGLEHGLCIRDLPTFLTSACSGDIIRTTQDWYFNIQTTQNTKAMIAVEKGVPFIWLSLKSGGWLRINGTITTAVFDRDGRGGRAEMHIGSRDPLTFRFEQDSTLLRYLCIFDHQGVVKALLDSLYAHHRHRLNDKEVRDEYVRLKKIKPGSLWVEKTQGKAWVVKRE